MRYLLLLVLFTSCCGHKATPVQMKPDSLLLTPRLYIGFPGKEIKNEPIFRVIKDTMAFVDKDSNTKVKRLVRDTSYFIPVKDSLVVKFMPTIKETVCECEGLIECSSKLKKWIENHKQYWPKKDSL